MQKIGVFGGSFDPIHRGHLQVAHCAFQQLKLDRVLFIPAARSPFKQTKPCTASDADRLAMTRLAISGHPEFAVSPWELEKGGVSYTVDTLKHLKQEYPGAEFFLLMGEDTFESLHRWKQADEVLCAARIAVAPRENKKEVRQNTAAVSQLANEPVYLDMPLWDVSSTQLRLDLSQARSTGLGYLPDAVQQYVRERHLYR